MTRKQILQKKIPRNTLNILEPKKRWNLTIWSIFKVKRFSVFIICVDWGMSVKSAYKKTEKMNKEEVSNFNNKYFKKN